MISGEEGQIVISVSFFIFKEAFETSGPECKRVQRNSRWVHEHVCVYVRGPLTEYKAVSVTVTVEHTFRQSSPFVFPALNQFRQTDQSDEARGHVCCPRLFTCHVFFLYETSTLQTWFNYWFKPSSYHGVFAGTEHGQSWLNPPTTLWEVLISKSSHSSAEWQWRDDWLMLLPFWSTCFARWISFWNVKVTESHWNGGVAEVVLSLPVIRHAFMNQAIWFDIQLQNCGLIWHFPCATSSAC